MIAARIILAFCHFHFTENIRAPLTVVMPEVAVVMVTVNATAAVSATAPAAGWIDATTVVPCWPWLTLALLRASAGLVDRHIHEPLRSASGHNTSDSKRAEVESDRPNVGVSGVCAENSGFHSLPDTSQEPARNGVSQDSFSGGSAGRIGWTERCKNTPRVAVQGTNEGIERPKRLPGSIGPGR